MATIKSWWSRLWKRKSWAPESSYTKQHSNEDNHNKDETKSRETIRTFDSAYGSSDTSSRTHDTEHPGMQLAAYQPSFEGHLMSSCDMKRKRRASQPLQVALHLGNEETWRRNSTVRQRNATATVQERLQQQGCLQIHVAKDDFVDDSDDHEEEETLMLTATAEPHWAVVQARSMLDRFEEERKHVEPQPQHKLLAIKGRGSTHSARRQDTIPGCHDEDDDFEVLLPSKVIHRKVESFDYSELLDEKKSTTSFPL